MGRQFYSGDPLDVAPQLLNKLLVRRASAGTSRRAVRIVEVEAYRGEDDPASHAARGPTARNRTMYGNGGLLYVYFTYGMHWCANAVCGPRGSPRAILLRAGAPVSGLPALRAARPTVHRDRDLARGPACLCRALGVDGEDDGADLVRGDRRLVVVDDGVPPPVWPGRSGRVGIRRAADRPWRFWVPGDPHVSSIRTGGGRR